MLALATDLPCSQCCGGVFLAILLVYDSAEVSFPHRAQPLMALLRVSSPFLYFTGLCRVQLKPLLAKVMFKVPYVAVWVFSLYWYV